MDNGSRTMVRSHHDDTWNARCPHVLLDGWAQPYVVLTHCRLLWAATFGTVTSKAEAAEWAVGDIAPSEYRDLIVSSIGYRIKPFRPETGEADPALAPVAAEFVSWATRAVHARADVL